MKKTVASNKLKNKKLDNKGFAIAGIIYSILLLFIIIFSALLLLLANRKTVLDFLNKRIRNSIEGTQQLEINFLYRNVSVANKTSVPDFTFDLFDGVVLTYNGNFLDKSLIEITSNPTFDQSVNGTYEICYEGYYYHSSAKECRNVEVITPTIQNYNFIEGTVQTFSPGTQGIFKLEAWGAQGGTANTYSGGYGGYAMGNVHITTGKPSLYIVVGGAGETNTTPGGGVAGGYNGGGSVTATTTTNHVAGGGGGATSITTANRGILANFASYKSEVVLVAGGGGGGRDQANHIEAARWGTGGGGGGYKGAQAISNFATLESNVSVDIGGTQNSGNAFGTGGSINVQGGGGGGYYGGYHGNPTINSVRYYSGSGGGGSGYIGGVISSNGIIRMMYSYNTDYTSEEDSTRTYKTTTYSDVATSTYAKAGNGAARITPLVLELS